MKSWLSKMKSWLSKIESWLSKTKSWLSKLSVIKNINNILFILLIQFFSKR